MNEKILEEIKEIIKENSPQKVFRIKICESNSLFFSRLEETVMFFYQANENVTRGMLPVYILEDISFPEFALFLYHTSQMSSFSQ